MVVALRLEFVEALAAHGSLAFFADRRIRRADHILANYAEDQVPYLTLYSVQLALRHAIKQPRWLFIWQFEVSGELV